MKYIVEYNKVEYLTNNWNGKFSLLRKKKYDKYDKEDSGCLEITT